MFKKKSCTKCRNKISDKYDFCPNCGNPTNNSEDDWGMLGKNDAQDEFSQFTNSLFGGIGGKVIGRMLNNAMKMLEKEMQKEIKNPQNQPKTHMELFINGKRINLNQPQQPQKNISKKPTKKISLKKFSQKDLDKIKNLPRYEPLTSIKRFSDKVVYEIEIPGVKSIDDISIIKFENSIEIKALTKDKVYAKLIPINLPITNYNLSKGKLVLELGESD